MNIKISTQSMSTFSRGLVFCQATVRSFCGERNWLLRLGQLVDKLPGYFNSVCRSLYAVCGNEGTQKVNNNFDYKQLGYR